MVISILGIAAILLALLAVALQRFYSTVPAKELRRLAARGDHLAIALYRPVAYGASLRLLLWILILTGLPVGFFLLTQAWPAAAVLPLMMLATTIGFVWLPSLQLSVHSARFAVWAAPVLDKVLSYTHGVLKPLARALNRYRMFEAHSGLFEKEDFAALLTQQKEQPDNRLSDEELELLNRTLHFGDRLAADIVQPRKQIRLLNAEDSLGPVLMDELHKNGQPSFLVYEDEPDHVIGVLDMRQATAAKQGGKVGSLARRELCFVHEDFTLPQVAEALTQTRQYSAVVVNSFEEVVGVITLEQLLREAFGEQTVSADMHFENRIAAAAYRPQSTSPEKKDENTAINEEDKQAEPSADQV